MESCCSAVMVSDGRFLVEECTFSFGLGCLDECVVNKSYSSVR